MSTLVKVWNKNEHPYRELYRDKWVVIAPKKSIDMDYEDAIRFLGTATPIKRMKDGRQDPLSYKWLEMDKEDRIRAETYIKGEQEAKSDKVFVCMKCNKEFKHKKALLAHVKEKHYEDIADEESKEIVDDMLEG
jgi:hypothetical protein